MLYELKTYFHCLEHHGHALPQRKHNDIAIVREIVFEGATMSFFLFVDKMLLQIFGPFLRIGLRANREKNVTDLRNTPSLSMSYLLEALLKLT
jgi:hypothetical protein